MLSLVMLLPLRLEGGWVGTGLGAAASARDEEAASARLPPSLVPPLANKWRRAPSPRLTHTHTPLTDARTTTDQLARARTSFRPDLSPFDLS